MKSDSDDENSSGDEIVKDAQSRKKLAFGAFKTMGLSPPILKGVLHRGYRLATPIQRKAIPPVMAGRDVVGMSRTGSGKTAAFLVPMFEKLQRHLPGSGPRALIISPSRDLALQTARFVKEIGKYTDLRTAVIIGGDRLEDQFTLLHAEPDILLATPGRLLHVMVEMELKLSSINYLVFDEADRLFELGFSSQVQEILSRTASDRQTLLFSATLPSAVADFVSAGLHNPKLVRLDVESKLSPQLTLRHLFCSATDKSEILVHLIKNEVRSIETDTGRKPACVVFVATRYHVDYIHQLLTRCGVSSTFAYSSMDSTARKINLAKFKLHQADVLIVTDVAARGIDIPDLDVVINYHFPAKAKLFIHRVGRVARAGRCGTAYSLVSIDEMPYLMDLHLCLGTKVYISKSVKEEATENNQPSNAVELGSCPRSVLDSSMDLIRASKFNEDPDTAAVIKTCDNAMAKYIRIRPPPSPEAVKKSKALIGNKAIPVHSIFSQSAATNEFLDQIRSYRPREVPCFSVLFVAFII